MTLMMQFFGVNTDESTESYVRPPADVNDVNMRVETSRPRPENAVTFTNADTGEKKRRLSGQDDVNIRRCTTLCTSNQAGGREVDYDDPSSTSDSDIDCYVFSQSDAQKGASCCEVVLLVHMIF